MTTRNPLEWPLGMPRRDPYDRREALFHKGGRALTFAEARKRLVAQISAYTRPGRPWRADLADVVITTDVPVRRSDGEVRTDRRTPPDPGIAVYFTLDGVGLCLPCDTFTRAADNVAAIAGHIEADRAQERYGVATVRQRFASFLALPAPGEGTGRGWWQILGVARNASADELKAAYRAAVKRLHPDNPATGNATAFRALLEAWEHARAARGL